MAVVVADTFGVVYVERMAKSNKASASTWRKQDAAYRKQEKERRDANKARRLARLAAESEVVQD